MVARTKVADLRDFTGGLVLRADQFQLGDNESPDIVNMDVDPRGGFRVRKGTDLYGKVGDTVRSLWWFGAEPSTTQPMASTDDAWFSGAGGIWTRRGSWETSGLAVADASLNNRQYLSNGTDDVWRWDGTTAVRMSNPCDAPTHYANDFASPTSKMVPSGVALAVFRDHLFTAGTLEDGTRFSSRVRFSHPFKPEAWRATDWFDIDPGVGGDRIIALQPFQDHLIVAKEKSVYAIYGYDWQSWQVQPITPQFGVVSSEAVAVSPSTAYWFHATRGVVSWDGKNLDWPFERLVSAIKLGHIQGSRMGEVRMAWLADRLWVSVPWGSDDHRTFVFDPSVSKHGAWVAYDLQVGPMTGLFPSQENPLFLAATVRDDGAVLTVENRNLVQDWDGDGSRVYPTSYTTSWMDFGSAAGRKRYHRPYTVYRGDPKVQIRVSVFHDYNAAQKRAARIDKIRGVGDGAVWGTDTWDSDATWSGVASKHDVVTGAPMGLARAVQLKFEGPSTQGADWAVDSVSIPFVPKRIR